MHNFTTPFAEGFRDAWVLAYVLVAAVVGGMYRVLRRIGGAYANHEPIEVAPGKTIRMP